MGLFFQFQESDERPGRGGKCCRDHNKHFQADQIKHIAAEGRRTHIAQVPDRHQRREDRSFAIFRADNRGQVHHRQRDKSSQDAHSAGGYDVHNFGAPEMVQDKRREVNQVRKIGDDGYYDGTVN